MRLKKIVAILAVGAFSIALLDSLYYRSHNKIRTDAK